MREICSNFGAGLVESRGGIRRIADSPRFEPARNPMIMQFCAPLSGARPSSAFHLLRCASLSTKSSSIVFIISIESEGSRFGVLMCIEPITVVAR